MWSYDFTKLDPTRHQEVIIRNAINYGTLGHWRWLVANYGRETIKQILEKTPASAIKPRAGRVAKLLLGVKNFQDAPRGSAAER